MAYIAMWRSGVVMATTDIQATDIVAITDILATMDILMEGDTTEGITPTTTGLIIEAIMDTHMAAITPGAMEGFGSAFGSNWKNAFRSAREWTRQRGASTPKFKSECSFCLHSI
jgi:hypothetical protein